MRKGEKRVTELARSTAGACYLFSVKKNGEWKKSLLQAATAGLSFLGIYGQRK